MEAEPTPTTTAPEGAVDRLAELRDQVDSWVAADPLAALPVLRTLAALVNERTRTAVQGARDGSASWEDVGRGLGMSRQAAHERFAGDVR